MVCVFLCFTEKFSSSPLYHPQTLSLCNNRARDGGKNKQAVFFFLVSRYKNNVLIDAKAHPEKYTAESNYNMHSLEIKK